MSEYLAIPEGMRCERCGMLAEFAEEDHAGVVHYACSHHRAPPSRRATARNDGLQHDKHVGHTTNMFKTRFWVCLILTLPILAYADVIQKLLPVRAPEFPGHLYLTLALASVIFFYGGLVFIRGAWIEWQHRLPGMMTLIALAIVTAYVYSVVVTFIPIGEPLFWEISTLVSIMLLGHWIEMAAVGHASGALRELAKLLPDTGERIVPSPGLRPPSPRGRGEGEGKIEIVPAADLREGDIVLVRPGAKIPADGEIVEGASSLNESMITGESRPVDKISGSLVIAGTVNGEGALKVRITKVGANTALAGIMRLVAQAQASRSHTQVLADRAAFILTIVAVGVSVITALAWIYFDAGLPVAMTRVVAVLVIACPHALGLAVPLTASISTTLSARSGLLVRDKLALEMARKIDLVLFDKTGTLTKGEYGVTDIVVNHESGITDHELLGLAAAVDQESEHPIAKAIVKAAQARSVVVPKAAEVKALPGRGVQGIVDGKLVRLGGENLVRELKADTSILPSLEVLQGQGKTIVYLMAGQKIVAAFGVADIIRPESREAVRALHQLGIKVAMITGDARPVAQWVAKELGIGENFAEVLPAQKVEKVQELQKRGMRVAMVGDGINDAPALATADVGIAIGAGTDVAIESAGIILMRSDPRDIVRVIKLARATYRKMVENLIWATGYNAFAIPAAAGAFAVWGIELAPAVAAILMSASTVVVALNAQLLRRTTLSISGRS